MLLTQWNPEPKANPGIERPGVRNPSGPHSFGFKSFFRFERFAAFLRTRFMVDYSVGRYICAPPSCPLDPDDRAGEDLHPGASDLVWWPGLFRPVPLEEGVVAPRG